MPEERAGGRAGVFVHVRRREDGGQRGIGTVARFFKNRQLFTIDQNVFVTAPLVAVGAQLFLNLPRHGGGLIGGKITDDHQLRSPFRLEIIAVFQHLFQGDRWQQRPTLFALEVRHLRNHLNRHDRLIVGFAFIRRIHHLGVPGFSLLQLLFGWRIAEVTVEQGVKQLR